MTGSGADRWSCRRNTALIYEWDTQYSAPCRRRSRCVARSTTALLTVTKLPLSRHRCLKAMWQRRCSSVVVISNRPVSICRHAVLPAIINLRRAPVRQSHLDRSGLQARQLGKGGPQISAIGIGAMSFSNFYGETDEAQSHAILQTALDEGVTHIDTANVYGPKVSKRLSAASRKTGCCRHEMFTIATKAGITTDPDTGARAFNNSAAHLEEQLDACLAALVWRRSICSMFIAATRAFRSRR